MNAMATSAAVSARRKAMTIRFVLGPAAIAAVFFFLEKERPFSEVWKPLALYYALAVPAFFLVDYLKRRAAARAQ